jgi:hypothetical protein
MKEFNAFKSTKKKQWTGRPPVRFNIKQESAKSHHSFTLAHFRSTQMKNIKNTG